MKRNLVGKILGKIKIFVQDFVPIRTALMGEKMSKRSGGIKRLQIQNLLWHLNRFPDADNSGSTV